MSGTVPTPFGEGDLRRKLCPICHKPADAATAPFCSRRCADVDLHRWLEGVYVVPDDGPEQPGSEDDLD